jgi:hypothetical protein
MNTASLEKTGVSIALTSALRRVMYPAQTETWTNKGL